MDDAAAALSLPFHPDLIVMAQPGRTLVPRPDRQKPTPRNLRQCARVNGQYRVIPQRPQRRSQALRLDGHRRVDPGQSPPRTHQTPTSSQSKPRRTTRCGRVIDDAPAVGVDPGADAEHAVWVLARENALTPAQTRPRPGPDWGCADERSRRDQSAVL